MSVLSLPRPPHSVTRLQVSASSLPGRGSVRKVPRGSQGPHPSPRPTVLDLGVLHVNDLRSVTAHSVWGTDPWGGTSFGVLDPPPPGRPYW